MQQISMFDLLEQPPAPQPDYLFGLCDCGWLLCGWHIGAVDQAGWRAVRHLWILLP